MFAMLDKKFSRELLKRSLEIIDDESKWVQGPMAIDDDGNNTGPLAPNACAWCCAGAMELAFAQLTDWNADNDEFEAYLDARSVLRSEIEDFTDGLFGSDIGDFNDSDFTKYGDVVEVLGNAVEAIKTIEYA